MINSGRPALVAVIGSPGSGKSTLCRALAQHYSANGHVVDHFEEDDILTRPAFQPVAAEFADGAGSVDPQTLIDAFARYVESSVSDGTDVVITDGLIPFIPSLLAWGHSEEEMAKVIAALEEVAVDLTVIMVVLTGDPAVTLPRAIAREAEGWIDGYIAKLSRWPATSDVVDLPSAIAHLRDEAAISRRLLARSRWQVVTVDATDPPADVIASVQKHLAATVRR